MMGNDDRAVDWPKRSNDQGVVGRRGFVEAAVWSVPVIVASVATPLAAASAGCVSGTQTFAPPDNTAAGLNDTFTVPAGVESLTYTVVGGGGGRSHSTAPGGRGAQITGVLTATPGQVLKIWAGQGGAPGTYPRGASVLAGGEGYGDGGDSTTVNSTAHNSTAWSQGGSGGGGSAILNSAGDPLVVAGGGGGGGGWARINSGSLPTFSGNDGGDAEMDGVDGRVSFGSEVLTAEGGDSGVAGGNGGDNGSYFGGSGDTRGFRNGGDAVEGNGGVGSNYWISLNSTWFGAASGGGGGGHTGGGAGQTAVVFFTSSTLAVTAAGGGGGGSFLATGVAGVRGYSDVPTNDAVERPSGFVTLSWNC